MPAVEFKDCVVIGAGPGGMTAAELLALLRTHAEDYGTKLIQATASRLEHVDGGFRVTDTRGEQYHGRTVLLATGIEDVLPPQPWVEEAIDCGAMRLCAICDGFEASDYDLAVYGPLHSALEHAEFMRTYSAQVTLVQSDVAEVTAELRQRSHDWGIELMKKPAELLFDGTRCGFVDAHGARRDFDTIYPVLGSRCHHYPQRAAAQPALIDHSVRNGHFVLSLG